MTPFENRLSGYFTDETIESNEDEHLYRDINNAACIIVGYLEIIQSRAISMDDQIKYLEKVQQEANIINKLLSRYLKPN